MFKKLLSLAVLALCAGSTWAQEYKDGIEITNTNNLFLYNLGSRKFLTDGFDYGTRATTDNAGRVLNFLSDHSNNGNGYAIYTQNYSSDTKAGYLNVFSNGVYLDAGAAANCTFETVNVDGYTNVYTIKINDKYLSNFSGDENCIVDLKEEVDGINSYWLIVPISERQAQKDYTYLLLNTDMNHPWEREAWTGLSKRTDYTWITAGVGGLDNNRNQEFYNTNFDMYQTLTNVPIGTWKLTCQGYYRGSDADNKNAMMYINSTTSPMKSIYADAKDVEDADNGFVTVSFSDKKLPNSQADASKAINAGYYQNEMTADVLDGNLKIGFKKETLVAYDWTVIDNIKLLYLGPTVSQLKEALGNAMEEANGYIRAGAKMNNQVYSDLDAALYNADRDYSSSNDIDQLTDDINEMTSALVNARASIEIYQQVAAINEKAALLDETGQESYAETLTKYNNGTLTAGSEVSEAEAAYLSAVKAQRSGDMTALIINNSFELGNTDGWVNDRCGNAANNGNFHEATGSWFFEKWTPSAGGAGKLADGTLSQTITGLQNGTYLVKVKAQNLQQGDENVTTGGFYLFANGSYVEISTKDSYKIRANVLDGKLTLGCALRNCTGNWIAIDHFELTYDSNSSISMLNVEKVKANNLCANFERGKDYTEALVNAISKANEYGSLSSDEEITAAMNAVITAENTAMSAYFTENYASLADGKYCIKNVDSSKWLGPSNSWGTQASLLPHPEYVELAKLDNGKYTIKTQVCNGGDSQYFNGSFMDGTATEVTIITIGGKNYIAVEDKFAKSDSDNNIVDQTLDFNQQYAQWEIISLDDMDAAMANATEAEPYDVTYKMADPNFGRNNVNNGSWTQTNVYRMGAYTNNLFESWHQASFSMKQTISDLPNGIYEVRCNAFYETDQEDLPCLFANDVMTTLPKKGDISSFQGDDAAQKAASAFVAGQYSVSVMVYVLDGTLEFGVEGDDNRSNWAIWDNFSLYYHGKLTPYTRNTPSGKYGTICLPYTYNVEGAQLYFAAYNAETEQVELYETYEPEAGKPYIYQANESTSDTPVQTFTPTASPSKTTPETYGALTGVFTPTPVPVDAYVMQTKDGVQKFYKVVENAQPTLSAYKAYLTVPETSAGAKSLNIANASETAIKALDSLINGNAKIYDLNGRELKSLQKGVNIVNGVKVFVK